MNATLMDLASRVFLLLATFKRKAQRGSAPTGDVLRQEIVQVFRELDQRAQVDAGLQAAWTLAKSPLVYLVDEVMTTTEWEYRGWWADNDMETSLLDHPQRMRGILFFDELEEAKKQLDSAGQSGRHQTDLMTVFYCCLRFGFEGKFAGQNQELEREAQGILAQLPARQAEITGKMFQEAYQHTIEVSPNYENVMRLATLAAIVVGMIVLFVGFREVLWNSLLDDLDGAAQEVGEFFKRKA